MSALVTRVAQLEQNLKEVRQTYRRKSSMGGGEGNKGHPELLCVAVTRHGFPCSSYRKRGENMCGKHCQLHEQLRQSMASEAAETPVRWSEEQLYIQPM